MIGDETFSVADKDGDLVVIEEDTTVVIPAEHDETDAAEGNCSVAPGGGVRGG